MIDSAYQEWQAKPVGFVSYGGVSGGLRAVEQLRQVFTELHTVTLRDSVSFASAWRQFDESGELLEPSQAQRSLATMMARMQWWASTLRTGRRQRPYIPVAQEQVA